MQYAYLLSEAEKRNAVPCSTDAGVPVRHTLDQAGRCQVIGPLDFEMSIGVSRGIGPASGLTR